MHINNIGFGFLCFGDEYYFKGTKEKIITLIELGFMCYVMTDKPDYFKNFNIFLIKYDRQNKSYSDKINIIKNMFFERHNIGVIIDSDSDIIGYEWVNFIKDYNFKSGITYIDTLNNHVIKKKYISDLNLKSNEWKEYYDLSSTLHSGFENNDLIWEYVIIFNKVEFNMGNFFETYNILQKMREKIDISMNKKVLGAGEGISLTISCLKNNIPLQFDENLSKILKKEIKPISKYYTPKSKLPKWMNQ